MSSKKNSKKADRKQPDADFHYQPADFQERIALCIRQAKKRGADCAAVSISENYGTELSVRMGHLETLEHTRDKSLGITVYIGQQRGHASTSDFSKAAVADTVRAACDIAAWTAADPFAALPEAHTICQRKKERSRDLELCHPWNISHRKAMQLALACEQSAMDMHPLLTNSDGASFSSSQGHFQMAHWRDGEFSFTGGYPTSLHSLSVAPIARQNGDMQRDHWYSSERNHRRLAAPESIGRYAAERALARLGARTLTTRQCPVLFEAPLATGLLGSFVQAVSGGALYRRTSFLLDTLDTAVFPKHISITEDPFVKQGKSSCPFDDEGVRVRSRKVVKKGVLQGYFLSSYSARKLEMDSTGNAGGAHNLQLLSSHTTTQDSLKAMLRKLDTGLFVTELMGQGINGVTGDYSRGASGYWVENGTIIHPVHEVTIAGNLRDMFMGIVAIGSDTITRGSRTTGSVLIDNMTVAGGS